MRGCKATVRLSKTSTTSNGRGFDGRKHALLGFDGKKAIKGLRIPLRGTPALIVHDTDEIYIFK